MRHLVSRTFFLLVFLRAHRIEGEDASHALRLAARAPFPHGAGPHRRPGRLGHPTPYLTTGRNP
jgi:hypothetical protein